MYSTLTHRRWRPSTRCHWRSLQRRRRRTTTRQWLHSYWQQTNRQHRQVTKINLQLLVLLLILVLAGLVINASPSSFSLPINKLDAGCCRGFCGSLTFFSFFSFFLFFLSVFPFFERNKTPGPVNWVSMSLCRCRVHQPPLVCCSFCCCCCCFCCSCLGLLSDLQTNGEREREIIGGWSICT